MPDFLQTTFLYATAAVAVPVLIHLFFRLKTKRVELGTIRFLRIVLEENARRRKVMRWLLLALRVACVLLLAAVFARPFLTAATQGTQQDLLVILIDRSATMQLKGEQGRLIDQAVADARRLIEAAGEKSHCEVAFFDHQVHPLSHPAAGGGTAGDAITPELLKAPELVYGATSFGSAVVWARDICVMAPAGRKQVHLFTDLQRSGLDWTDVEPLPDEVEAILHDLGKPVVNNLAVTEVRTGRTWIRPDTVTSVRATLMHGGAFALDEVAVVLEVGRLPALPAATDVRNVDFARLEDRYVSRERLKLEPGSTATLDFELPPLKEGLWQGRVTIEHLDDLQFDNQRYFAISATPGYPVLIVNSGAEADSISRESYFLEAALKLAVGDEEFADSPFAPAVVNYEEAGSLPELHDFSAIVLANVPNLTRADAGRLAKFVKAGGGLLVYTGDKTTEATCSALAAEGLSVGQIGETKVAIDLPWRLDRWDDSHPVFQPFKDPQHGDLRQLIFAAYTPINPAPDAVVLAEFNTEAPAVLERQVGAGSAIWVATSCGREWSDWCLSRLFLPTLHQLLGYQVGLTSGGRVRQQLVDAGPPAAVANRAAPNPNLMPAVPGPGVWQGPRFAEVVNTSPRESETERCTREEFENRFALKFQNSGADATQTTTVSQNLELRQDEFWHWVACALLLVLLLEGFVANRTTA